MLEGFTGCDNGQARPSAGNGHHGHRYQNPRTTLSAARVDPDAIRGGIRDQTRADPDRREHPPAAALKHEHSHRRHGVQHPE
jgi:hypothetical protein